MGSKLLKNTYLLLDQLGAGNAGEVFKAVSTTNTDKVKINDFIAIKRYKKTILEKPHETKRIYQELHSGLSLDSPNVVKSIDLVQEDGDIYLIMEFLKGKTLAKWLEENHTPDFNFIKKFALDILRGLCAIHNLNLIHRDLKPDNIMVTVSGLKIMDLGVVKNLATSTTITGENFLGTIRYAAPEYLFGETYESSIDVFSFGLILYEFVFGRHLLKETYWTKMIVELADKTKIGPQDFLGLPQQLPARFSSDERLFLWIILNCTLEESRKRIGIQSLLKAFEQDVWNDITHSDIFLKQILRFENSSTFVSNFIFLKEIREIIKKPFPSLTVITNDSCGFIERKGNVLALYLNRCKLLSIPQSIIYLSQLQILDIKSNELDTLPDFFRELKSLQYLNTLGNPLKNISSIFIIPNITSLFIESFGNEENLSLIGNLNFLKEIVILGVKYLPESFGKLKQIESVHFLGLNSEIKDIPPYFFDLTSIKRLKLQALGIENLPESIDKLLRLIQLDLGGNKIKKIPESIRKMVNLEELSLGGNLITDLTDSIGYLKALKKVDIHDNPIKILPPSFIELKNLEELDVIGTELINFERVIQQLPKLKKIHVPYSTPKTLLVECEKKGIIVEFPKFI